MSKKLILITMLLLFVNNIYSVNSKIFSHGSSSQKTLATFLSNGNSTLGDELVNEFALIYIEEAKLEGINWDIAFVQMCLETGFLKYGGLVDFGQNNFCGLGSFDNKQGASFETIRDGVKAHIQHLKAYSSTEDLVGYLLDPRFHFVERGSAIDVLQLAGKWAEDPKYGNKLISLLKRMNYLENGAVVLKAELPMGFESVSLPVEQVVTEIIEKEVSSDLKEESELSELLKQDISFNINNESVKNDLLQQYDFTGLEENINENDSGFSVVNDLPKLNKKGW